MIKLRLLPAFAAVTTLYCGSLALANYQQPSVSIRAGGPLVQYGSSGTACTTSQQANSPSASISVRASGPTVQYGTSSCNTCPSYQYPTGRTKQKYHKKEAKTGNQWSDWVAQALSNTPEVKNELDTWTQYAVARPQIIASTSDQLPPSEHSSFPLGLSGGKSPTLTVLASPRSEDGDESGSKFSPYMLKLRPILSQAYNSLTRQYYQLGAAYIRQDLLAQRRQALEELREVNREAANSGDGSWAGIIYLDNVLEEVNGEIAKNDLLIDVLSFNFQQYPQGRELQLGSLHIWNKDDFWDFFPKTPGAIGSDPVPSDEVNKLFGQFKAASDVAGTTRTSNSLQGVIDQLDSEPHASDADFAAGEEVITSAKLRELEARLQYIDKLLETNNGVKVIFSFSAPAASQPIAGSPARAAAHYAKDGSAHSGKLLGILILSGFIFALWYFRRVNNEPAPTQPDPLSDEIAKNPQANHEGHSSSDQVNHSK
jgi:hypothetical protein